MKLVKCVLFLGFIIACSPLAFSQTMPYPTGLDNILFGNPHPEQIKISVTPISSVDGTALLDEGGSTNVVFYYTTQPGQTPNQIACIAYYQNNQLFSCIWPLDIAGQFWFQASFSGTTDPNTGQFVEAPSVSPIYHVVGGPGGVTVTE